jgi:hypothetical protein
MNLRNFLAVILVFILFSPLALAQEDEISKSPEILGVELELLLSAVNVLVASILFIITFLAFKRDGRQRLFYVSLAFLIFAVKSLLVSLELFVEIGFIDPIAVFLEFLALLSFFIGVFKK